MNTWCLDRSIGGFYCSLDTGWGSRGTKPGFPIRTLPYRHNKRPHQAMQLCLVAAKYSKTSGEEKRVVASPTTEERG